MSAIEGSGPRRAVEFVLEVPSAPFGVIRQVTPSPMVNNIPNHRYRAAGASHVTAVPGST